MGTPCVAVFGASGRTGRSVIEAARANGLVVQALSRRPNSVGGHGVEECVGALTDARTVDRTLNGCVAACVVIGPRPPYTEIFCADATRAIVEGLKRTGCRRIICQTGAMIGDYRENRSRLFELMAKTWQRRQPRPHADRVEQERVVREAGLDWTIVKPPRLTSGGPSTALRVGPTVRVGLLTSVSRGDLGELIVREIREPRFSRQVVFVRG